MAKKDIRVKVIKMRQLSEDGVPSVHIDTGARYRYLAWKSGYAGGITPLLDSAGRVVVTPVEK